MEKLNRLNLHSHSSTQPHLAKQHGTDSHYTHTRHHTPRPGSSARMTSSPVHRPEIQRANHSLRPGSSARMTFSPVHSPQIQRAHHSLRPGSSTRMTSSPQPSTNLGQTAEIQRAHHSLRRDPSPRMNFSPQPSTSPGQTAEIQKQCECFIDCACGASGRVERDGSGRMFSTNHYCPPGWLGHYNTAPY